MANIVLPIRLEIAWDELKYNYQTVVRRIHYYEPSRWGAINVRHTDIVAIGGGWETFFGGARLQNISGPWGDSWTRLRGLEPDKYIFDSQLKAGWWHSAMVTYDAHCTFRQKASDPKIARRDVSINYDASRKGWFCLGDIHSISGIARPANIYSYIHYNATIANNPFVELKVSASPTDQNQGNGQGNGNGNDNSENQPENGNLNQGNGRGNGDGDDNSENQPRNGNQDQGNGRYLWVKFEELNIPVISNISPVSGENLIFLTPTISAVFIDGPNESGIDVNSLKLVITGGMDKLYEIKSGAPGLNINEGGFSYAPGFNLPSGLVNLDISISDNQGNTATAHSSFNVNVDTSPDILNISPINGEVLIQVGRPTIRADFVDRGAGVDPSSFSLVVKGPSDNYFVSSEVATGAGLVSLDANGFEYIFPEDINEGGLFTYEIRISDTDGNVNTALGEFSADYLPLNPKLSLLDVSVLENVGTAISSKLNAVGIITLADLVSAPPFEVAMNTGVNIRVIKDYIKRGKIVCSEVRYKESKFGELMAIPIYNLIMMTDTELYNYDMPMESLGELIELKDNLETMLIALDDNQLKGITLQDLVW